MQPDLTNREWLTYWQREVPECAEQCAELVDVLCEREGRTRREFIKARDTGNLILRFEDPDMEAEVKAFMNPH